MQSTVCRENACASVSKSNIFARRLLRRSAEAIGAIEETLYVKINGIFKCRETAIVACTAQPIDLALREILVAAADLLGHVDILDVRRSTQRAERGQHHVLEAARRAGSDVEQAGYFRRRQQPHHHAHDVVDIDEVAALVAVGDALAVRPEQL